MFAEDQNEDVSIGAVVGGSGSGVAMADEWAALQSSMGGALAMEAGDEGEQPQKCVVLFDFHKLLFTVSFLVRFELIPQAMIGMTMTMTVPRPRNFRGTRLLLLAVHRPMPMQTLPEPANRLRASGLLGLLKQVRRAVSTAEPTTYMGRGRRGRGGIRVSNRGERRTMRRKSRK